LPLFRMNALMRKKRLTEFFRDEYTKMVKYVRRFIDDTGDRDAHDIVHDVMTNLFDKTDITAPIDNLAAYVYRSLKNKITDTFRRQNRRQHISLDQELQQDRDLSLASLMCSAGVDTASQQERQELYRLLYQALESLSEKEQAVVIATEFENITFRELAESWQVALGTLLARKARAIEKIKRTFASYQ